MGVSLSPEILFDLVLSIKACLVGIYYWLIFPIMWDINEIVNEFYKFFICQVPFKFWYTIY